MARHTLCSSTAKPCEVVIRIHVRVLACSSAATPDLTAEPAKEEVDVQAPVEEAPAEEAPAEEATAEEAPAEEAVSADAAVGDDEDTALAAQRIQAQFRGKKGRESFFE